MDPVTLALAVGGGVVAAGAGGWLLWRRSRAAGGGAQSTSAPAEVTGWRDGLASARRRLVAQLGAVLGGERPVAFDELEEVLVAADVGMSTTQEILGRVEARTGRGAAPAAVRDALRDELMALVGEVPPVVIDRKPWVVLVIGVNGVGKTTTIGKLAAWHIREGRKVLLVAGDTFRAAAIDQLGVWAERTGADFVHHAPGGDPGAVVFDGIRAGVSRGVDVVLIDSAGRLHTRDNLMGELAKVRRVIERELPGAPHETLLVLDATTGQNAVSQARTFAADVGATGIVMTKLDGTAKGGVLFAIRSQLGVPVRYVGVGESAEDLLPFDGRQFVTGLFQESFIAPSP